MLPDCFDANKTIILSFREINKILILFNYMLNISVNEAWNIFISSNNATSLFYHENSFTYVVILIFRE